MKLSKPAVDLLCAIAFGGFSYFVLIAVIAWAHFYPGPDKTNLVIFIRLCIGTISGISAGLCTIWTGVSIYEWTKEHLT